MKTLITTSKRNNLRFRLFFVLYILAMAVAIVGNLITMRLTGDMGQAAVEGDPGAIIRFLWIITGITAARAVAAAGSALALGRFAGKAEFKFRENFAKFFLRLPFAALEKKNTGEMLSVYTNDIPAAAGFVSREFLTLITDIVSVVVSLIFMFTLHWLFTLIFLGMFPVLILVQALVAKPIQKLGVEMSDERSNFNAVVNDALQNTSTIVAYSLTEIMEKRYLAAYDKFFAKLRQYILTLLRLVIAGIFTSMAPSIFLMAASAVSTINNNMALAEFIALVSIGSTAGSWLMMLSQQLNGLGIASAGAIRFNEETTYEPEEGPATREKIPHGETLLKFENVSFSYGEENRALDDVSFEIKRGEKVAFVGESGSGKSTALKLILGLYPPSGGKISHSEENFAYVPQDNFLFPESIGGNISLGNAGTAPENDLLKACANAGILEFIEGLPEKFDTVLAEAAENVSGGQRQRIAIARAFYQDAPVVLFDEATSSLDPIVEAQILETMQELMQGRTVIMVAHRESTIAACDRVIYFKDGRVEV